MQERRLAIVRDKIYINGGRQYTKQGKSSMRQLNDDLAGVYFSFNLSSAFNRETNISDLLDQHVAGDANTLPDYIGGAMFANDDEFVLYGGKIRALDKTTVPDAQSIIMNKLYASSNSDQSGFRQVTLGGNVIRYIVGGAAASAPSENLGFCFSGKHAANWSSTDGIITKTDAISNRLIIADLSEGFSADNWSNDTLPRDIPGRPGAELAWVPVSKRGMLVAIGGSSDVSDLAMSPTMVKVDVSHSHIAAAIWPFNDTYTDLPRKPSVGPKYMKTISVYDVDSKKWFQQGVSGDVPPTLAEFCTTVSSTSDSTIHNIYVYGGYNGTYDRGNRSDDVYVLTLPKFEWVKLYEGKAGGSGRSASPCISELFRTFDLNKGTFVDSYDPSTWKDKRDTTELEPVNGWDDDELGDLFKVKYTKTIKTWFPYKVPADDTNNGETTEHHRHLPKWVPPFLGVICGLIGIAIIVLALWLIRRRRRRAQEAARIQDLREAAEKQKMQYELNGTNDAPAFMGKQYQAYSPPVPAAEVASFPVHELPHNLSMCTLLTRHMSTC
ncbi:hypothetical protein KEM52_006494 [Ascosphaera acerosa]|nr:hypothetical protein KEM52_006494 [Ascosphaera acerosa]